MVCKVFSRGLYIKYRTTGKMLNIRHFVAKITILSSLIQVFSVYTGDYDLVTHPQDIMQHLMDSFSKAYNTLDLRITLKMTAVMC